MKQIITNKIFFILATLTFTVSNVTAEKIKKTTLSSTEKNIIERKTKNSLTAKYIGSGISFLSLSKYLSNIKDKYYWYNNSKSTMATLVKNGTMKKLIRTSFWLGITSFSFPLTHMISYISYDRPVQNEINKKEELKHYRKEIKGRFAVLKAKRKQQKIKSLDV